MYTNEKNSLVFKSSSAAVINNTPSQTSCDSLSIIAICFEELTTSPTWHILVTFAAQPDTEWVHVGDVRFLGTVSTPALMCTTEGPSSSTTEEPSPSTTEEPSSSTTEEPSSSTTEEPAVSLSK